MSHEITDTDQVFTVGDQAWHGLDTNFKGNRLTAAQAREFLAWKVKKVPATYEGKPVDGAYFTVREDTDAVLGVVGSMYSVIQNHWLFKLLDPVVDSGECLYETGGSLMGGRKVWALAKLPRRALHRQGRPYSGKSKSHAVVEQSTEAKKPFASVLQDNLIAALKMALPFAAKENLLNHLNSGDSSC